MYNDSYDKFCGQMIKVNPSILEIGCGPGNITKYLLHKRPDFKIEAIDISPNMIALAKKNNPAAGFKVMDCRNIDTLETRFDAVIGGFCLPYLSQPDCLKLIKDLKNILAGNGIIYLSFVEGDNHWSGYQTGSSGDRTYFYYHHLDNLEKVLKENNFETVEVLHKNYSKKDGAEETHTIIIAKNKQAQNNSW